MIEERDIYVAMRDGTRLAVDVYRPDAPGKYPVLYASALHNKDIQGPDIADILPPQPAHAPLWFGPIEAGNTRYPSIPVAPASSSGIVALTSSATPSRIATSGRMRAPIGARSANSESLASTSTPD